MTVGKLIAHKALFSLRLVVLATYATPNAEVPDKTFVPNFVRSKVVRSVQLVKKNNNIVFLYPFVTERWDHEF